MRAGPSRASRSAARDAAVRVIYRAGWRFGPRLPPRLIGPVAWWGSTLAVRRGGRHLETLAHNLEAATGTPTDAARLRAASASYLRTFGEVLTLPGWGTDRMLRSVTTSDEHVLRTAMADGGAVVALPHCANYDLAGAWACLTGMPVSTVAEQLGAEEFAAFTGFRRRLGLEVWSHRDPRAIPELVTAVGRGRLVCLVADRDLLGTGLPVAWPVPGRPALQVTMPAGPALVARRSGVPLIPAVCSYRPDEMHIAFGAPIRAEPGRDGLVRMTQHVATFFAAGIAAHPEDWHMLQPFFGTASTTDAAGSEQAR